MTKTDSDLKLLQANENKFHEVGMALAHTNIDLDTDKWLKIQDEMTLLLIKALQSLEDKHKKEIEKVRKETIKDMESGKIQHCDCCGKVKGGKFICGTCEDCL